MGPKMMQVKEPGSKTSPGRILDIGVLAGVNSHVNPIYTKKLRDHKRSH